MHDAKLSVRKRDTKSLININNIVSMVMSFRNIKSRDSTCTRYIWKKDLKNKEREEDKPSFDQFPLSRTEVGPSE